MTLSPSRDLGPRWRISHSQIEYLLPFECERPWCTQPGTEKHHIVPRSRTAGPKLWITIDEFDVRNVIGLCKRCHLDVTGGIGGHQAKITWDGGWAWFQKGVDDSWTLAGWISELPELRQAVSEGPIRHTDET